MYTKPKGKLPDFNEPVVLKASRCTVEDFCNKIHKQIMKSFKHALVYGVSSKHRPQRVGRDHVLCDQDILQVRLCARVESRAPYTFLQPRRAQLFLSSRSSRRRVVQIVKKV